MSEEKADNETTSSKRRIARRRIRSILLRLLLLLLLVLLVLLSIALIRGCRFESRQPPVEKVEVELPAPEEMAARLAAAVRFETVAGPADEAPGQALLGLHEHLRAAFPRVHAHLGREIVAEYSLLYTWKGSDAAAPALLIAGHLDVVPADPTRWSFPPYSGAVDKGYIYGRGTMDDKVSVLAALEAVEQLLREGFAPKQTIYLAFGHDEEIGGYQGAKRIAELLEARKVQLEATLDEGMVITEGVLDGLDRPGALIAIAEKGFVNLELVARGDGGHSSMPPRWTAVGVLSKAIVRLQKNPMPADISGVVATMFEYLGPELSYGKKLVMANLWLFGRFVENSLSKKASTDALLRSTMAPTMLSGSSKANVLPQEASAVVNVRIKPGDSVEGVLRYVRKVVDDERVAIHPRKSVNPQMPSSTTSRIFKIMQQSVRQLDPSIAVAPGLMIAYTDSRHYASISKDIYRFTPLRLGPEDLNRIHGVDERIAIANYAEAVAFNVLVLRAAAGP